MTVKVELDSAALVRGVEEGRRAIDALSKSLEKLDRASLNRVQAEINSLKGSPLDSVRQLAEGMDTKMKGAFDKLGRLQHPKKLQELARQLRADGNLVIRALSDVNTSIHQQTEAMAKSLVAADQGFDRKLSVRQKAIKEATRLYEEMVLNNPETRVTARGETALYRLMRAGAQMSPTHIGVARNWAQTHKDEAKAIIDAATTAQIQRGKSASRFTLDDTRSLLGLPSADEMRTFSTSLRNQMLGRNASASRFTIDDTRALLGLPPVEEMRNFASALKTQMLQRGKSASRFTLDDTRSLLGLPPISDIARIRADMEGRMKELANMAKQAGIRKDLVGGDFSPYNAKRVLADMDTNKPRAFGSALRALGGDMNTLHSSARGLASGFGLLWLTWGQMIPLLTGAALSYGFTRTIKIGADVQQSLSTVAYLGEQSAESVANLSSATVALAKTGPQGPSDIAKALKTLSLAGLNAEESLLALPSAMKFAIAGTVDLQKGAESLVAISTAFGFSAKDFNYVGDIISKSAAISMASVEDMSEAYRQASVVAQEYNVSLKDTALSLALLSNIGIKGSAAGTAMRQMYNELSGASEKAQKVMKNMNFSITDGEGQIKPLIDIIEGLNAALAKYPLEKQRLILQDLSNERGMKGIVAALAAYRKELNEATKDSDKTISAIRQQLEEAPGFMAVAAIGMSLTAENQIKSVVATLQAALVDTFNTVSPVITLVSQKAKDFINSPEFKSGLLNVVGIMANFTSTLVNHIEGIISLAKAYIILKVAIMSLTIVQTVSQWFMAFATVLKVAGTQTALVAAATGTLATTVSALGATALMASSKMKILQMSLGWISLIGSLLATVYTGWLLFRDGVVEASSAEAEAARIRQTAVMDSLAQENKRLEDSIATKAKEIELILLGKSTSTAAAEARISQLEKEATANYDLQQALIDTERLRIESERNAVERNRGTGQERAGDRAFVADLNAQFQLLAGKQAALTASRNRATAQFQEEVANLRTNAKQDASMSEKIKELLAANGLGGNKPYPDNSKTGRIPRSLSYREVNPVTALKQQMQDEIAIIEIRRRAEVLSNAEAEEAKYQANTRFEKLALDALDEKWTKTAQMYAKEYKASQGNANRQLELQDNLRSRYEEYQSEVVQITSESTRRQVQYNEELAVSAAKVTKAYDKFLRSKSAEVSEEEAKSVIYRANKRAYPEIVAQQEAQLKYYAEFDKMVSELTLSLEDLQEAQRLAFDSGDSARAANFGIQAEKVAATIRRATKDKDLIAKRSGDAAYRKTLEEEYGKFVDDFSATLAAGVADSIIEGGKNGGEKLRKYLQDLLIRKPLVLMLEASIKDAFGGSSGSGGLLRELFNWSTGRIGGSAAPSSGGFDLFDMAAIPAGFGGFEWGSILGKASGGTVNPNSMYRVNENGIEMLSVGGKDYLMTGAQQGSITPAGASGVNISYAPQIHIDSRTDQAQVAALVHRAVQAGNAKLVDDLRQARVI